MLAIRLGPAVLAIALCLLLPLPSTSQRPPEPPLPLDPMLNARCPKPSGDCIRGLSLQDVSGTCCPSCSAYSESARCPSSCLNLNLSATPCFSFCGEAGCRRARCGEPLNGGSSCCNATKIFGCQLDKIFLDADCCPDCSAGSPPASPAHCRFNQTRGVGKPECDSIGNCRLKPVEDRRDDNKFSYDLLHRVCSASDIDLLKRYLTLGAEKMTGEPKMPQLDGMTLSGSVTMPSAMGSVTLPSMSLPQLKDYVEKLGGLLRNMTSLTDLVRQITSPTCREPMACIAGFYNRSAKVLKTDLDSMLRLLNNPSSLTGLPDINKFMGLLNSNLSKVITEGASCMAKVQWQTPCVTNVRSINIEELLHRSRCNRSSTLEFGLLQSIADKVANETAENRPPGLEIFRNMTCRELRNPCAVDIMNALMKRVGSGCGNAKLLTMTRERMRADLIRCSGGLDRLTNEDLANALSSCQLSPNDVMSISQAAPTKLQQVLLDGTSVPEAAFTAKTGSPTLGALVQERLKDCPDLKAAVDREFAKNLDIAGLAASAARDLIGALSPAAVSRVGAKWDELLPADIFKISMRLEGDPDREAKCQELVPRLKDASLSSLFACIDKIPTQKLRTLFPSGANLQKAAQAFNYRAMSPRDIARSASALRDMLKDVTATSSNCLIYMNSLFSFPRNRIERGLCLDDTCFKQMCSLMPNHPNTAYCQGQRPPPSASSLSSLGAKAMAQLPPADVRSALSNTKDKASFLSLISQFFDSGSSSSAALSSSAKSGIDHRISAKKRRTTIGAVMDEFQKTFLQGANLSSFSATETDASLLSQLNSEQLRRLPCSQLLVVAYKAKVYISNVDSGSGSAVSKCVCDSYANCSNITSAALSEIGGYAMFISTELVRRIPTSVLPTYCQALQAVDAYEKSIKLSIAHQRLIHELCTAHGDMSGSGGSNDTNLDALTSWNTTVVSAVMPCTLTTAQIDKLDQGAVENIILRLVHCPPNRAYLSRICTRYFKLYNDSATSGNYSTSSVRMCFQFADTLVNITKVNRDDVRTESGSIATDAAQINDSCTERASHGHKADCDSAEMLDNAIATGRAQRFFISVIDGSAGAGGSGAPGRRRKRSTPALTCNDIQNLASGVAQVTAAQIQAMAQSEFLSCFSTFGMADTQWNSEQCAQLKAKTELAYNVTSNWTSSVLLTIGCLTQCWSSSEIAQIPYSDVAHISDTGKYCRLMPNAAKAAIVTAYIANAKANDSGQMTRSELSSLGYLACDAPTAHIGKFNETNVLNSMTELGTPGPCSEEVMTTYVNRLKASSLGSTVATWQTSYFTSISNLIGGLSSSDIPTLSSSQIGYIDASAISGMSATKFKDFTPSQLSAFSASQKSAVTSGQLALLSDSQKQALGHSVTSGANWLTENLLLLVATTALGAAAGGWQLTV